MNTVDPTFSSFIDAYSDGVVAFIHGGRSHALFFDRRTSRFFAEIVVDGTTPTDVDVWIGQTWQQRFENLNCATDKADLDYSAGALKSAIAKQLLTSQWALEVCAHMSARVLVRN